MTSEQKEAYQEAIRFYDSNEDAASTIAGVFFSANSEEYVCLYRLIWMFLEIKDQEHDWAMMGDDL